MAVMAERTVKVSLAIPEPGRFEAVLKAAAGLGFRQEAAMPRLGVATGTAPGAALDKLRTLDGIGSVEEQRSYRAS